MLIIVGCGVGCEVVFDTCSALLLLSLMKLFCDIFQILVAKDEHGKTLLERETWFLKSRKAISLSCIEIDVHINMFVRNVIHSEVLLDLFPRQLCKGVLHCFALHLLVWYALPYTMLSIIFFQMLRF